jgi:anti-anti-sigma factor
VTHQARFSSQSASGVTVVSIEGEVDIANVGELRLYLEQAIEEQGAGLVADLTKASYFDSRTIALLAEVATKMRIHHQRMALVAPASGFAARILEIAGLPQIIPEFSVLKDATDSVKQPAAT